MKMYSGNTGVKTESTVRDDHLCLAQPHGASALHMALSRMSVQQCHDTEGELWMVFQLFPRSSFQYHYNLKE